MISSKSPRSCQRGITLIEVMIAIGIALVVAALAIALAVGARRDAQEKEIEQQLLQLVTLTRQIAPSGDYTGFGFVPRTMCNTGKIDSICNVAQDGAVTMKHAAGGTLTPSVSSGTYMRFSLENVPKQVCINLPVRLQEHFPIVQIGSSLVLAESDTYKLTTANTSYACNSASYNGRITLTSVGRRYRE